MVRISKDIVRYEFIGLRAKITDSKNRFNKGMEGTIIDETKYTFVIRKKGEKKRVLKKGSVFEIKFPDKTKVRIKGDILVARPEERIKMRIR